MIPERKNRYHYISSHKPEQLTHFDWRWLRRTSWSVANRDGLRGIFTSWWLFNHLQLYYGIAKCDGSESLPDMGLYDYTDEPSELRAFRWRAKGPDPLAWNNMAGS